MTIRIDFYKISPMKHLNEFNALGGKKDHPQ